MLAMTASVNVDVLSKGHTLVDISICNFVPEYIYYNLVVTCIPALDCRTQKSA